MTVNPRQPPEDFPTVEVKSVGIRWYHPAGFRVDRPLGSQDYAFMQWLTPALLIVAGEERREREGGCIVYRPDDPQCFGGDLFTPFGNNWFHFHGPMAGKLLDACGIPLNQPLHLRDSSFIEPLLNMFQRENLNQARLWRLMIGSGVERFFIEMAREIGSGASVRLKSARSAELRERFVALRDSMRERSAEPWTLKDMADSVYLSQSRFSQLYREFFDANPIDDLIRMRIAKAEYYLCLTNMPLAQVAALCGFSDYYYFSRQFKNKTGESPTSYRLLRGGTAQE